MEKKLFECLSSQKNEEVITVGLISNPVEGLTKQGKPYVDFQIYANGCTMTCKVWDIGYEEMQERYGVKKGAPVKVHGVISINPQSGEKQICLRDGDIPALSPLDLTEDEIEGLAQATPVKAEDMISAIKGAIDSIIPESILKGIANWGINTLESSTYFPYGEDVHKEKGGLIAHVYNCVYKLMYYVAAPEFNKGVVLTALLLYRTGTSFYLHVDRVTGLIKECEDISEYGSIGQFMSSFVLNWVEPFKSGVVGVNIGDIKNVIACVNACNGIVKPMSIEAVVASGIVRDELDTFRIYEATKGLEPGTKAFVKENGEVRTVYKF